jgi:hypothetical protein
MRGRDTPAEATRWSPMQFGSPVRSSRDDEAATMERVEAALAEVCSGHLSPDSGHHHQLEWAVRFGANMLKGYRDAAE